jgi:phosphate transport system protein
VATRLHYTAKMNKLERTIMKMGYMVVKAVERAMEALVNQDAHLANQVIEDDTEINELEIDINNQCTRMIAEEQPVAKDLRIIINAFKMSHSLERIADNGVHIAKSTIRLSGEPYMKPLIDIPRMAGIAIGMLKDSLDAYAQLDCDVAVKISTRDSKVDELYSQIFRELITYMHEDPSKISQAMTLLFICRRLERVADQSTHICEGVHFVAKAEHVELNP